MCNIHNPHNQPPPLPPQLPVEAVLVVLLLGMASLVTAYAALLFSNPF